MKTNKQYNVLSPDGFSIHFSDTYKSREDAIKAFEEWKKRYEGQGFYSSAKYGRIPLDELENYCELIEVEVEELIEE